MNKEKGSSWINAETGEIKDGVKSLVYVKQDEYLKNKRKMNEENREFIDMYGNFVFKKNNKASKNLENKVTNSNLVRTLYLATYLDYDNNLKTDEGKNIKKSMLMEIMKMSKNTFYNWYNEAINLKLIIESNDGCLSMNKKYCLKGSIPDKKQYNRLFINSIRMLYESNATKNLSVLGQVFRMLPYVNIYNNTLCWNTNEKDPDKISPIFVSDLINIFDKYHKDQLQFKKAMSDILMDNNEPVMLFTNSNEKANEDIIIFNPRLSYSGNNNDLNSIHLLFIMIKNKNERIEELSILKKNKKLSKNGQKYLKNV